MYERRASVLRDQRAITAISVKRGSFFCRLCKKWAPLSGHRHPKLGFQGMSRDSSYYSCLRRWRTTKQTRYTAATTTANQRGGRGRVPRLRLLSLQNLSPVPETPFLGFGRPAAALLSTTRLSCRVPPPPTSAGCLGPGWPRLSPSHRHSQLRHSPRCKVCPSSD